LKIIEKTLYKQSGSDFLRVLGKESQILKMLPYLA